MASGACVALPCPRLGACNRLTVCTPPPAQMWFEYRAPVTGPMADRVALMPEFDSWASDPMQCVNGLFQLVRMVRRLAPCGGSQLGTGVDALDTPSHHQVPKRTFQFMFDVDGVQRAAMDELYVRAHVVPSRAPVHTPVCSWSSRQGCAIQVSTSRGRHTH